VDISSSRLKSLELQGYKTFATRTQIELAPTITAVVGPNGSGKSNIADAIHWVLGEQSYSLMRGRRTEDMIFSGSESRPRASMASATITFDNDDGWMPIDFSEVSISRRAYRDGQNEYVLNGQRVRLRDVYELLAQCGLAKRTYTIIGQGLVDAALSLKADERRRLFEEAAGIGLYRTRREEALRRLEKTRRNLERVQDILTELGPRLRSLKRQAKRAFAYQQVKQDLNDALRIWYGHHWYRLLHTVSMARHEAGEKAYVRDDLREQQAKADKKMASTRSQIDTLRAQLHAWTQQVSDTYTERDVCGRRLAVARERSRWLEEQEDLARSEISSLDEEAAALSKQIDAGKEILARALAALEEARVAHSSLKEAGEIDSAGRLALQEKVDGLRKDLEALVTTRAVWEARRNQLEESLQERKGRLGEMNARRETSERESVEARGMLAKARDAFEHAVQARESVLRNEAQTRARLESLNADLGKKVAAVSDLRAQCAGLEASLQILKKRSEHTEHVLHRFRDATHKGKLRGLEGRLSENMRIAPEHQNALAVALGEFADGLAFDTSEDIETALAWLEAEEQGQRAALMPLRELQTLPPLETPSEPGCVGVASRLIDVPASYRPAIDLLLGRTLVVKDRKSARGLLSQLPLDARVVTLDGDLYYPTGQVIVGSGGQDRANLDERERVSEGLREANSAIREAEKDHQRLADEIGETRERLDGLRRGLDEAREGEQELRLARDQAELEAKTAQREFERVMKQLQSLTDEVEAIEGERETLSERGAALDAERAELEASLVEAAKTAERAGISVEMARTEARLDAAQRSNREAENRLVEIESRIAALDGDRRQWAQRLADNHAEQESVQAEVEQSQLGMEEIETRLASLAEQMSPAEESLSEAEETRSSIEAEESRIRSALQVAEREHSHAQIELARRQEELVSLKRRIEDDFGLVAFEHDPETPGQDPLPFKGLVERLERVAELPEEVGVQVDHLRAQLRRMGAVNPEAQREYEEVNNRIDFLNSQVKDLNRAESQIQEVIAELDLLMEREFRKTYDAVAVAFRETFKRLFGGGSARLALTDPDDMTNTGIDIEARLPGRREQGLAMLSGGERSLTACALIFALLKVSPTPFCVLDEVDAMLDETNVGRFTEMLGELSRDTQFVVITHNRLTVQAADMVYGVTMGSDSASKVISLKLDEAEREIAA
jgi:chromosome segregation protein